MYSDRELLELAAKARGGIEVDEDFGLIDPEKDTATQAWSPLTDDGDAFMLAAKLNLDVAYDSCCGGVEVSVGGKWDNAPAPSVGTYERIGLPVIRMCIVRAAAAIGEAMQ